MLLDSLLSLNDAWHWVQIGFCVAVGASIIIAPLALIRAGNIVISPDYPEYPEPHCSRCCPELDDFS